MTKYEKYKLSFAIVLSIVLLYILYGYSLNDRYVIREETLIILDTRTGTIYIPKDRKYIELDNYKNMDIKNKNK